MAECGSNQLYAGLKVSMDDTVHVGLAVWALMEVDKHNGFLVIVFEKAFNSCSRVNMLWSVCHLWPIGDRFAFNYYCFTTLLICCNHLGEALWMFIAREGSTQDNPLSMFLYGIGILPLIRKLKELHIDCVQPWYADNTAALGAFQQLDLLYEDILCLGPGYGYIPKPSKCNGSAPPELSSSS